MTRFPASGGGSGPPYTYVMDGYPSDAEEGESLYHITEDAAYVYTGSSWVEQTVTNHGQLAGISEGDHRSDQRVADLAPVQSRYTDSEARTAVDGSNVTVQNADNLGGTSASNYLTGSSTRSETDSYSHTVYNSGDQALTARDVLTVSASFPVFVEAEVTVQHDSNDDFDSAYSKVELIANYSDGSSSVFWSLTASRGGNSGTTTESGSAHLANGQFNLNPKQIDTIDARGEYKLDNDNSSSAISSDHDLTVELGYL